ncbi:MAG: polyprenol monophosphomannose synthase [Chloroflexota bacterium]
MKTTVVLPTYNEAENLPVAVAGLFKLGIDGLTVLIIDDNSPDGTGSIADKLVAQNSERVSVIHREGKLGLGTAYRLGFQKAIEAGSDIVIQMDVDGSHDPNYLPKMLEALKDSDVVIGSRYTPGGSVDPTWGWRRRVISWGANTYTRIILGLKVRDTTSGYKCFRTEKLRLLPLAELGSQGYVFQIEMAYVCQRAGFRYIEVPIVFAQRRVGKSKLSSGVIFEVFWRVWQIRFK